MYIKRRSSSSSSIQESCAIAKMTARCALYKWIKWAVVQIRPFEICQDGRPWKPYPTTKREVCRITRCGDMAIRVSWGIWNHHFGGRVDRRGSAMAPFERAMVVSYRFFILTVALSVTIRPQFAIECLRRSNQQGVGTTPKFLGIPLGVDIDVWDCRERTSQAN